MSPDDLIRNLLKSEAAQAGSEPSTPLSQEAVPPEPKPRRPSVDRMIRAPLRKVAAGWATTGKAIWTYQPLPRHIALLLMATILLMTPWFLPSLVAIAVGSVAAAYLVIGHDHSGKMIAFWFKWLKRRDSQGAEVIRARAEHVSGRLANWLDQLPKTWTTGLYLPDFTLADDFSEKLNSDPFERLMGDAQNR